MRPIRLLVSSALVLAGTACFAAAALSAHQLSVRSEALARRHQWQRPGPWIPPPVPISDVEPVELELEELPPEPEPVAQLPPPPPRRLWKKRPPVIDQKSAVVEVSTGVDPEDAIRMALRQKRAAFEHCYEAELKKQAAFSGFLVIAVSVSSDGKVTDARIQEGSRRDAAVGACIVAQLRKLVLPALTSEADLLIPIRLQAKEPS